MPEGPEIYLAAQFINAVSKSVLYKGKIVKSEVSKNPNVDWNENTYHIRAESRGKELMVMLYEGEKEEKGQKSMNIIFRFGMSGCFKFTSVDQLPKHAHLRFFTRDTDIPKVLSFVDYRRFGRWEVNGTWSPDRGPDPMWEYPAFRDNVLKNLHDATFNKPICETLLNQKFFNGIGNYLRAEILYRYDARPFECARDLLSEIKPGSKWYDSHLIKKNKVNQVKPDLLDLCHILPKEVISLGGGKGYDVDVKPEDDSYKEFKNWLQCYYKDGMMNLVDHNKRTIWFTGDPGPLVPKEQNSRKKIVRKSRKEQNDDEKSLDVDEKTKGRKRGAKKGSLDSDQSKKGSLDSDQNKKGSLNGDQNKNGKMTRKRKGALDGCAVNNKEKSRKLRAKNVVKEEELKEKPKRGRGRGRGRQTQNWENT